MDLFIGTGAFQNLPQILARNRLRNQRKELSQLLYLSLRRKNAPDPLYSFLHSLSQNCRRLFKILYLLHRSKDQRGLPEQKPSLRAQRGREACRPGSPRTHPDCPGYNSLWRRPSRMERIWKNFSRRWLAVNGLRWIRILYAYPKALYFTEGLLEILSREEKICPYLDLPIQHIDDAILRRMGRKSKGQEIRSLLQKIRAFIPEISLRSSLIVGFPGEGEAQFNSLLEFVEETQFDHLGVFKYSREEGTPASRLPKPGPGGGERGAPWNPDGAPDGRSHLKKTEAMVGKSVEVLVDGEDRTEGDPERKAQDPGP